MTVTRNKKITIYLDNNITPELRAWLAKNGDSYGGRRLLRMGYLLEQSGLADQIMLLATQKGMAQASEFDLVAKAVELLAPLQTPVQPEQPTIEAAPETATTITAITEQVNQPEPETKIPKKSLFAAGRKD
ncbi:hypothetical protein [Marinospirillum minutulum]|uniref:hypothetical protein n=1 Tax=Marinospirillum minutulum TaxID=64974 RepID=UPI00041B01BF|nr:hypothetical protein [Marinospirillum minutulum]